MKKFESGKKYSCKSVCDHTAVWNFTVVTRTESSVWLDNGKRYGVKVIDNEEMIYPLGKYSMCPILRASGEVN